MNDGDIEETGDGFTVHGRRFAKFSDAKAYKWLVDTREEVQPKNTGAREIAREGLRSWRFRALFVGFGIFVLLISLQATQVIDVPVLAMVPRLLVFLFQAFL